MILSGQVKDGETGHGQRRPRSLMTATIAVGDAAPPGRRAAELTGRTERHRHAAWAKARAARAAACWPGAKTGVSQQKLSTRGFNIRDTSPYACPIHQKETIGAEGTEGAGRTVCFAKRI